LGPHNAPGEKRVIKRVSFGDRQWAHLKARAQSAGMGVNEFIRLACDDMLNMDLHRAMSSE
jgi:hypothetical protein